VKKIIVFLVILAGFLYLITPVFALKKRVSRTGAAAVSGSLSYSTVKLNRPSHSIDIYFRNLGNVSRVDYELSYMSGGIDKGVVGSLVPPGSGDTRNLYFGTCSKGVCTPHYSITGATLTVRTALKSGGTNGKLYRIKY
jgi:hypothetical protein